MYLLIDLSIKDKIHLSLFDESDVNNFEHDGRNRELLSSIDAFFKSLKFDKKDLRGIMVVIGTGSFTNTRISVVVANSFAFLLGIPLLAIGVDQASVIQKLIPNLLAQPKGQYISATYSAPPNIG